MLGSKVQNTVFFSWPSSLSQEENAAAVQAVTQEAAWWLAAAVSSLHRQPGGESKAVILSWQSGGSWINKAGRVEKLPEDCRLLISSFLAPAVKAEGQRLTGLGQVMGI